MIIRIAMVDSPCIGVCSLRNGVCLGCQRTEQQIKSWMDYSDEEKLQVLEQIFNGQSQD